MQDAELAQALATGSQDAFAELFDRYGAALHDFCASVLRNREEARDVVQDTLVLAWERAAQLRDPSKLRPWLFAIARREALRRLRARRRSISTADVEIDAPIVGSDPADAVSRDDAAAIVWAAAAGLSPRDQVLLDLHVRQGLDGQALADAIGTNANHAYVLVNRLRARVDRSLGALLVVRLGRDDCEELQRVLKGWDGTFTPLWRKRVVRHVDDCEICSERRRALASPFTLLPSLAAVMLPSDLRDEVFDRIRRLSSGQELPREQRPRGWPRRRDGFPPPMFVSPRRRLLAAAAVIAIVVVGGGIGAAITTGSGDERRVVVSDERRGPTTSTSRGPALAVSTTTAPPTAPASGSPGSSPSDTTGPTITGVGASPASIVAGSGSGCENNQSVVTVGASDPSGISSVTISWAVGAQSGGAPAQGGGYLVGPLAYQAGLIDTPVVLTVTARDGRGNATTITNSSALRASTCFF